MKFKINPNLLWPLVFLVVVLTIVFTKPWIQKPVETVSVTSQGKADVTPNVAQITATIETQNKNLDIARAENEKKVSAVISALKKLGIEEKDIKTQNISGGKGYEIMPMQDTQTQIFPPRPFPTPTNQFSTSLEITVRDLTKSDEVIAALTSNGATNLYGPNLTVSDDELEKGKSEARKKAVDEARQKAEELAGLSDRKIDRAVNIKEGEFFTPTPIIAQSEADLMQKAGQIQPGQNEVSISLSVEFSLK